ncbi:hypothetical protein [Zobellia sp. 1_MG-2023]|uniref:hypothetical protein n=1 Tax=Zobellia sp. 1_MG-2023 TaxID=3062626 RepID=UPI0026E41F5E|nr:hypothetical protein [Zobellia sp. 1_MG-2023]MDO6821226.1 hypothetical protein [Zobellia sp. 1_MG-2023]
MRPILLRSLQYLAVKPLNLQLKKISEKTFLSLSNSEWEIGTFDYVLTIGDSNSFDLNLKLEKSGGEGCCSNTLLIKSLQIDGDVQEDTPSIFKILLD